MLMYACVLWVNDGLYVESWFVPGFLLFVNACEAELAGYSIPMQSSTSFNVCIPQSMG